MIHYINFRTKTKEGLVELFEVDYTRLSKGACYYLDSNYSFSSGPEIHKQCSKLPDSFYDLINVLDSHEAMSYMVSRKDLITLLAKDQVPHTPTELSTILFALKHYQDSIEFEVIYPFQIFLGNMLYKSAHQINQGYRNFDLTSAINLDRLLDGTSAYIDKSYRSVLFELNDYLYGAHDNVMGVIDKSGDLNNSTTFYRDSMFEELEHLLDGRNPYHLGVAIAIKNTMSSGAINNFDLPLITLAVSENTQFYLNALNQGDDASIINALSKYGG